MLEMRFGSLIEIKIVGENIEEKSGELLGITIQQGFFKLWRL